MKTAAVVLM